MWALAPIAIPNMLGAETTISEWLPAVSDPTALFGAFLIALLIMLIGMHLMTMIEQSGTTPMTTEQTTKSGRERSQEPIDSGTMINRVRCQYCGTANEPVYTYCRSCVSRLSESNGCRI
ncbi:MAG: hypothetical protein ABEH65_11060 [Halobacteriales archaeon]